MLVQTLAAEASATTIVVRVDQDSVTVGADSRSTNHLNGVRSFSTVNKIHRVGNLFFALSGLDGAPGYTGDFDPYGIATRVLASGGPLCAKPEEFFDAFRDEFETLINAHRFNPNFAEYINAGGHFQIVFFGAPAGTPSISVGDYQIEDLNAPRLKMVPRQPTVCVPNADGSIRSTLSVLGESSALPLDGSLPRFLALYGTQATICHMIEIEVEDQGPDGHVWGPVNIVAVGRNGNISFAKIDIPLPVAGHTDQNPVHSAVYYYGPHGVGLTLAALLFWFLFRRRRRYATANGRPRNNKKDPGRHRTKRSGLSRY